jgi:hypothetical protein
MIQALKIRTLIASSSVFQQAVGVETVEEAENRVYLNYVKDVDAIERPYAIVQMGATTQEAVAGGSQQRYLPEGIVSVSYVDTDANPSVPGESIIAFYNFFEAAWQDVLDCSGLNGLPKIASSTVAVPMQSAEEHSPGETPFWIATIEATWNYTG